MTTDQQVTYPPVTHPETITLKVAQERPKRTAEDATKARTERRRRRPLPPPKTIAAVALVVAALELLIWQVGGPVWGIIIHAALAVGALAAVGVALAWRRRSARRAAGRTPAQAASGGTPRAGRGPLGRLFGPGRKAKAGASQPGGNQRKPGLLGKLFPGRRNAGGPGQSGKSGRPSAGRRNPLSKLFGPGRKGASPKGGSRSGPGASRPGGKSPTGSPSGVRKPSPTKPNKKGLFWPDFIRGLRGKDQPKPTGEKRKPSPGPSAKAKPAPEPQAEKPKKEKTAATEQMVKEAVQQAADAKPVSVPTPRTVGGNGVSGMDRIRAAAEELAGALKDYDEEDMHVFVQQFPQLGEAFTNVAGGIKQMASRAETEWPTAKPFAEGLRTMSDDVRAAAGTAEGNYETLRRENETDIERGQAPRGGSRRIEGRWNV